MAKGRGMLQNAAKAVKQQKKNKKPSAAGPASKSANSSRPGSGPPPAKKQKTKNDSKPQHQQQNQKPTIPFSPSDNILLIGEGDLSFAASLLTHHRCTNVTATVLEPDAAALTAKYPHAAPHIALLSSSPSTTHHPHSRLLYSIDATKLAKLSPHHPLSQSGPFHRIIFNFPHTGGASTDVNRQVRRNQELLVAFFQACAARLPSPGGGLLAPHGTVVVTLFEAEPYTLWNVRDLARHAGLQVQRSFRFVAGAYPGYAHARTLGVVRNKRGEVAREAWRGEERAARSYVLVRKGEGEEGQGGVGGGNKGKKRKRGDGEGDGEDESSSDEDGGVEAGESGVDEEEGWGEDDDDGDEVEGVESGDGLEEKEGGDGQPDRGVSEDASDGELGVDDEPERDD